MLIVETIKGFLLANNLADDFIIQAYQWKERDNNDDAKYLVIKPSGNGQFDTIFNDEVVSLILVGAKQGGQLSLARECEAIKRFIVNAVYDDVWAFDVVGQPAFYLSKDERVIFELNIKCRTV